MPQNKLAPTSANALIFDPYEQRYKLRATPTGAIAENVDAALIPALMRAHFPDYIANARATVSGEPLRYPATAYGEYVKSDLTTNFGPKIQLKPRETAGESNTMTMERVPSGGYVGVGGQNTTTNTVLNALGTMLHEAYHARMQQDFLRRRDPSSELKDKLGRERYSDFMTRLEMAELPSVQNPKLSDSLRLNEFLSTAVPTRLMQEKGIQSSSNAQYAKEIQRLTRDFPEIKTWISEWMAPEKKAASFNPF